MEPKGLILFTGEPGTGKTSAALQAYPLKKTAYLCDDIKKFEIEGVSASELESEFGLFVNLIDKYPVTEFKLLEYYEAVMREIDNIPDGKFDSIVFDTWTRTGKAIRNYAKVHPLKFRESSTFSTMGKFKGPQEWNEAAVVENAIVSQLSNKCKALFIITHITGVYRAGVLVDGANEPDCHKSFKRILNASFWLRHNPNSGVPIVLVMKRMSKIELKSGTIQPVNLLPRKMTPTKEDTSVWSMIKRYWEEPVGNREPLPDEIPNEFELSILSGQLTESQMKMFTMEFEAKKEQDKQEANLFTASPLDDEIKAKIIALKPSPAVLIHPQLILEYPALTLAQVEGALK